MRLFIPHFHLIIIIITFVGFEVLTAVSMKIAVFRVVAPCSLVAARTSETLVNFYQTTRCYNPEDSNLHHYVYIETLK
jgi:hypothetical protein